MNRKKSDLAPITEALTIFSGDFKYSHFGEVTYGVDERGEVGLLSRNIRIDAELQDVCYSYTEKEEQMCEMFNQKDTFGGHTKVKKVIRIKTDDKLCWQFYIDSTPH